MHLRAWNKIPINESGDDLLEIPLHFFKIEPHPYLSLGAPYGKFNNPWMLRSKVLTRLQKAQDFLFKENQHYKLAIFDAWRPLEVQLFMIDHVINQECIQRGINKNKTKSKEFSELVPVSYTHLTLPTILLV